VTNVTGAPDFRVIFQIRTVVHPKNAVLDFGTMILALGLRRGVFGSRTMEDVLGARLFEIRCESDFEDRPIFCSKKSRINLSWNPIDEHEANESLREMLRSAGMSGGKGESRVA